MREIKYRAYVNDVAYSYGMGEVIEIDFDDKFVVIKFPDQPIPINLPLERVEILEYTGIEDKDRFEIYEGDIVQFNSTYTTYDAEKATQTGKVFYRDCNFCITDSAEEMNYWLGSTHVKNVEVVGNIYENPELLEATND